MRETKKNASLGAKSSTASPARMAASTYATPSARVNATSCAGVAPASAMWYPEIEMVFHLGISFLQYANVSVIRRSDWLGGKMYVPRAMYSFSTSFWMVPFNSPAGTPCSSATSWYSSSNSDAGALIVMDVDTVSSGMPSSSTRMSSTESMATPTLPTSPCASGASESMPICVGRSKATDSPIVPAFNSCW